jgi:hypothetical protein
LTIVLRRRIEANLSDSYDTGRRVLGRRVPAGAKGRTGFMPSGRVESLDPNDPELLYFKPLPRSAG